MIIRCLLLLIAAIQTMSQVLADDYTPAGLYDHHALRLDNGLEVYLKPRNIARSTSIRLVVNYGSDDSPCGKTETAHYLEHLLFTGTSKYSETELDMLITDNGGSWNAYTSSETTLYEIDIYSPYTGMALQTLYDILTDSTISNDNVATSLDIIRREAGGEHAWLSRYLYTLDIGKTGYDKGNEVLYAEDEYCPEIPVFDNIQRTDIIEALDTYYVPDNMALIIVGDIAIDDILQVLDRTFSRLEKRGSRHMRKDTGHGYSAPPVLTGTLNPLRGNDADVYIRYRLPGYESDDAFVFSLMSLVLSEKLFNSIRVDRGLSYNVVADAGFSQKYGTFQIYADAEIDNMRTITTLAMQAVDDLLAHPLSDAELSRIKRGALLNYVHAFQDNSTIADFYAGHWLNKLSLEGFERPELLIEAVDAQQIHEVAKKYLTPERAVISHDYPTLTHEQVYIILILLGLLLIFYIRQLYTRSSARKRHH